MVIVIAILIWARIEQITNNNKKLRKWWRKANILLFLAAVSLIIRMTLWGREIGEREYELMPFHTFTTMSYNNEALRTLLMNVALFLPLGLTLPYIFTWVKKNTQKWLCCVLVGCFLSVSIEVMQYYWAIGLAETDDVVCNTLGCALGVMADVIADQWSKKSKLE